MGKKEDELLDDELDSDLEDDFSLNDSVEDYFGEDDSNTPMKKHNDLLKELTNFDQYLKDLFTGWLGLKWSDDAEEFVADDDSKPIMNIAGAKWCLSFLKTYTRKNNIITHIDRGDYINIMADVIETIWLNLGTRDDLGISCDGDLLRVCTELEHAVELVLMGAGGGKYNQLLSTTINRHENVSQVLNNSNQVTKTGLVDKMRGAILGGQ